MMVCTAPPSIGLAIMLLWRGSPTTPCVMVSLIGLSPASRSDHPYALGMSQLIMLPRVCGADVRLLSAPRGSDGHPLSCPILSVGGVLLLGQDIPVGGIGTI